MTKRSSTCSSKRRHTVKWTYELRLGLHILHTDMKVQTQPLVKIFNYVFAEHLRDCGLVHGVEYRRLSAQLCDKRPKMWEMITSLARDEAEKALRERLRRRIYEAADTLGVANVDKAETLRLGHFAFHPPGDGDHNSQKPQNRDEQSVTIGIRTYRQVVSRPPIRRRIKTTTSETQPVSPPKIIPYDKGNGKTILLSPKQYEKAQLPVCQVDQVKARPETIQFSGLLFRHWESDATHGRDSVNGFWSRRHHREVTIGNWAPSPERIDPVDVTNHLDRKKTPTPFVSTSNRLLWTLKQLVKNLHEGTNLQLSIINKDALQPQTVFHALPYHQSVVHRMPFDNGAWCYKGTYEFWVWAHIPGTAIVNTIDARVLYTKINEDPDMKLVFRLQRLMTRQSLINQQRTFRDDRLGLSRTIVTAIAKLCLLLGVEQPANISHIVRDVIEGWAIEVRYKTTEEWSALADHFVTVLGQHRQTLLSESYLAKRAFLEGIQFGLAKPNGAHLQMTSLQRRWEAIGLSSPARVLMTSLDRIKQELLASDKQTCRQLRDYATRLKFLPIGTDDASIEEEETPRAHQVQRRRQQLPSRAADNFYDHDARATFAWEGTIDWRDTVVL